MVGSAPPPGFAVASVPAVMVSTPAFAATPAFAVTPAAFSAAPAPAAASIDYAKLVEEFRRQSANAAGPSAAAPADCKDPCLSIMQLRKDVDELIAVTDRLTDAVNKLADKK